MDAAQIVAHIMACAGRELEAVIREWVELPPDLYGREHGLWKGLLRVGRMVLTEWLRVQGAARVDMVCEGCQQRMPCQRRGERTLVTMFGEVRLVRRCYYCRGCREARVPLDQQLGMGRSPVSKALREMLALVAANLPFEQAMKQVGKFLQLELPLTTGYRHVRQLGAAVCLKEEWERQLVEQRQRKLASVEQAPERLYLGMDGAKVHVDGAWHEVKVGVIYDDHFTYQRLARYEDSTRFTARYAQQVVRAGGMRAKRLVAIADAANWIHPALQTYFPRLLCIVDWYHALDHLGALAKHCWGEGTPQCVQFRKAKANLLWKGKRTGLLRQLRQLQREHPNDPIVQEHVGYFEHHQHQMDYPRYRKEGLPIGSGVLESTVKQLVTQRAKGAGMRWRAGLDPILALRGHLLDDSWDQAVRPFL